MAEKLSNSPSLGKKVADDLDLFVRNHPSLRDEKIKLDSLKRDEASAISLLSSGNVSENDSRVCGLISAQRAYVRFIKGVYRNELTEHVFRSLRNYIGNEDLMSSNAMHYAVARIKRAIDIYLGKEARNSENIVFSSNPNFDSTATVEYKELVDTVIEELDKVIAASSVASAPKEKKVKNGPAVSIGIRSKLVAILGLVSGGAYLAYEQYGDDVRGAVAGSIRPKCESKMEGINSDFEENREKAAFGTEEEINQRRAEKIDEAHAWAEKEKGKIIDAIIAERKAVDDWAAEQEKLGRDVKEERKHRFREIANGPERREAIDEEKSKKIEAAYLWANREKLKDFQAVIGAPDPEIQLQKELGTVKYSLMQFAVGDWRPLSEDSLDVSCSNVFFNNGTVQAVHCEGGRPVATQTTACASELVDVSEEVSVGELCRRVDGYWANTNFAD